MQWLGTCSAPWSNTALSSIGPKRTNFSDIRITVRHFFLQKTYLNENLICKISTFIQGLISHMEKHFGDTFYEVAKQRYGFGILNHSELSQVCRQHLFLVVCQIQRQVSYVIYAHMSVKWIKAQRVFNIIISNQIIKSIHHFAISHEFKLCFVCATLLVVCDLNIGNKTTADIVDIG